MPCILPSGELNGISVPAICARHGGQWIDEPSLLTEPGIGNTMPPSMEYPGLIEPGVGNTFGPIGKSYSGGALQNPQKLSLMNNIDGTIGKSYSGGALQNPQKLNIMNNLDGAIGTSYPGSALQDPSKVMNAIGRDTDDFGNPLNANFAGDTNFGLLRDRAVNKFNTKPFNKPFLGPVTRTNTSQPRMTQTASGLRPMSVRESSKEDRYNVGQKFKSIFGMDDESVARDKASKRGSGLIGTSYSGGPTQAIWHKNQEAKTTDNTTTDNTKTTDNATAVNNGTPTPEAIKGMAKSGEMSEGLLSKMGTKDYWMTGIEGGSGAWDNKLFRLGEMMAYMGTPLSKRGDSPAKRWTAANTDSAKVSKALTAAQSKLEKGKIDNLMKIASTSPKDLAASIVEYLPDELDNTWLGLSDKEKSSMSMSIAIRASQAMKLAGADGKHMPYAVAMKLAANQILKEHNKK